MSFILKYKTHRFFNKKLPKMFEAQSSQFSKRFRRIPVDVPFSHEVIDGCRELNSLR